MPTMSRRLLGIPLLCMLLVTASASVSDDVIALLAFRRAIYEDPLSKLSDWNSKDKDPCTWSGVGCSAFNSRVVTLVLSNSSLRGFLAPEIGSLGSLQKLILDHNTLVGSIPKEIGMLKNLTELDLGTNQLAGPIPSEIGDMPKITKIDLHANRLNGAIPSELGKLESLTELRLSNNSLTGIIPQSNNSDMTSSNSNDQIGLCQLSQLTDIDLSYNLLLGDIPTCLKKIQRSSLVGNCFQNNGTVNRPVQQCQEVQDAGKDNGDDGNEQKGLPEPLWLLILEVIAAVSLLGLLTLCTITGLRRSRARSSGSAGSGDSVPWTRAISWKENTVISIDDDLMGNVPKINRQELAEACEDFSNIIGSSHETVVYKGTLKDGREIAVVSLNVSVHYWNSYEELHFQKEVLEMARLSHENAAKMVGYCKEPDPFSRMLVFQYPPNGTLYEHLHDGEGCQISWPRRMKLAIAMARVLRYLHNELQPPFAVAALTSSSVYLTEDFTPKIIDFERWRYLVTKPGLGTVNSGSVNGATDSRHKRFMDVQANTFAFGVILLELISGRATLSKDSGDLVDWARKYLDQPEEFSKLVDLKLQSVNEESLGIVCNVVNLCIDPEPSRRPSMSMIAAILEEGIGASAATLLRNSSLAWAEAELAIS